jgi:hypothetical protein
MNEAQRRWRATLEWRRDFGTDAILDQPHPYFDAIKKAYPHYYCMSGRDGNPVYIERSGQVDQSVLRRAGASVDTLVWHYVYMTEFLYRKLYPSETAKTITVFDVEGRASHDREESVGTGRTDLTSVALGAMTGVGIRDLAGEAFDFLRRSAHIIQVRTHHAMALEFMRKGEHAHG